MPTVFGLPIFIQVANDAEGAAIVVLEGVEMFLVTRANWITGEVAFQFKQSQLQFAIGGLPQTFHLGKKFGLGRAGSGRLSLGFIQPVDAVAAQGGADLFLFTLPGGGGEKNAGLMQGFCFACQLLNLGGRQETGQYAPTFFCKLIDDCVNH